MHTGGGDSLNIKHSKNRTSHFLRHSARKQGGLILQRSRAHIGWVDLIKTITVITIMPTSTVLWVVLWWYDVCGLHSMGGPIVWGSLHCGWSSPVWVVHTTHLSLSALFFTVLSDMTFLTDSIECFACRAFISFFSLSPHTQLVRQSLITH